MKKRINSVDKIQYPLPATLRIDLIPQKQPQIHKHHVRCPLPKPSKKESNSVKKYNDSSKPKIKEFPNPILNELRHLISNSIDSSDRISRYVDRDTHNCALNLYYQDRKKLVEYMNTLVIREVQIDSVKGQLQNQSPKKQKHSHEKHRQKDSPMKVQTGDYLLQQLNVLKNQVDGEIKKKRSKSAFTDYQVKVDRDISQMKDKVSELQKTFHNLENKTCQVSKPSQSSQIGSLLKLYKKLNQINDKDLLPSVKINNQKTQQISYNDINNNSQLSIRDRNNNTQFLNLKLRLQQCQKQRQTLKLKYYSMNEQIQKMKNGFIYLELLVFKSTQMLTQYISFADNTQSYYLLDKQKINLLLSTLQDTAQYTKLQNAATSAENLMQRMKQQAQSMVLYVSELRRKQFQLMKEKDQLLESLKEEKVHSPKDDEQYEELKFKINKLNDEMGDLIQQVDKKDELIEYLKLQNDTLKDDMKNMQELNKNIKDNDKIFGEQLIQFQQKLKYLNSLIQKKEEQINELLSELESKNKDMQIKIEEIQSRDQDINSIKHDQQLALNQKERSIELLKDQKKLIQFQKHKIQSDYKELNSKYAFILEESNILQKKIQDAYNNEEQYKQNLSILEQKIQFLEKENMQLYKDVKIMENKQENDEENSNHMENQYVNLQNQYKKLQEENQEFKKKVVFYQRQLFQLAKLADTSWYENVIEEKDARITQLQKIINGQQDKNQVYKKDGNIIPRIESITEVQGQSKIYGSSIISAHQNGPETESEVILLKGSLKKLKEQVHSHLLPQNKNQGDEYIQKIVSYDKQLQNLRKQLKQIQILSYTKEIKHLQQLKAKNNEITKMSQQIEKLSHPEAEITKQLKQTDAQDDYIPFLQQEVQNADQYPKYVHKDSNKLASNNILVQPQNSNSAGQSDISQASGRSKTSKYQINVVNENAKTIDNHKAVHKNKKTQSISPNKVQDLFAHPLEIHAESEYNQQLNQIPKFTQVRSNVADANDSDDEHSSSTPKTQTNKRETKSDQYQDDAIEQNLTHVSKVVNLDKQNQKNAQKMKEVEEMSQEHIRLSKERQEKAYKKQHYKKSDSISKGQHQAKHINPNFFKHVDRDQQIKAEMRMSGCQKDTHSEYKKEQSPNKDSRKSLSRNIYIKMNKNSNIIENSAVKNHRTKSCYAPEI